MNSEESLNEMSYLTMHFTEVIGPWYGAPIAGTKKSLSDNLRMDLFDMKMYFSRVAPLKASRNVLLRSCIAAIASKQLGRITTNKEGWSLLEQQSPKPVILRIYPDVTHNEWFFKAASYYDKAISYLRIYLQNTDIVGNHALRDKSVSSGYKVPEQISSPGLDDNANSCRQPLKRRRTSKTRPSGLNNDDLLVAISILSEYELLDHYERELLQYKCLPYSLDITDNVPYRHLGGLHTLLKNEHPLPDVTSPSTVPLPDFSRAYQAAFWNFARVDCTTAYANRTKPQLNTEDLALWEAVGIQVTTDGRFYGAFTEDTTGIKPTVSEELASRTLIWILLQILHMIAEDNSSSQAIANSQNSSAGEDLDQYCERLNKALDDWYAALPETFYPFAKIRRTDTRFTDQATGSERFAELLFSIPNCGAVLQLYHFARTLLLLNQPLPPNGQQPGIRLRQLRDVSKQSEFHSREVCGLMLGNTRSSCPVPLIEPLYLAGVCLEAENEKKIVLNLLQFIENETGYSTDYRRREIRSQWGWDD